MGPLSYKIAPKAGPNTWRLSAPRIFESFQLAKNYSIRLRTRAGGRPHWISRLFARHPFDVAGDDNFTVELTAEHHDPVYKQSPPTPIHLRESWHDLAILQYFDWINTLAHSSTHWLTQSILVLYSHTVSHRANSDFWSICAKLITLFVTIDSNNFPITTMADAGTHLEGKTIFCYIWSQPLKMADPLSVQLLISNFASRTFAYQRLAQGLSRSVSAFSFLWKNT